MLRLVTARSPSPRSPPEWPRLTAAGAGDRDDQFAPRVRRADVHDSRPCAPDDRLALASAAQGPKTVARRRCSASRSRRTTEPGKASRTTAAHSFSPRRLALRRVSTLARSPSAATFACAGSSRMTPSRRPAARSSSSSIRRRRSLHYYVRAYDLAQGGSCKQIVFDAREKGESPMTGSPVTRATGPSGRWIYTLYGRPNGALFVHALDSIGRARLLPRPSQEGVRQRLAHEARVEARQASGRRRDEAARRHRHSYATRPRMRRAALSGGSSFRLQG